MKWGIDLGGTKIEGAILDEDRVLLRKRIPTEAHMGYSHILERIAHFVEQMGAESGHAPECIGIGTPGTRDPHTGLMRGCNTTALNGRPLLEDLGQKLGVPIRIANDANCFALAEASLGAGRGHEVVFGVIMGTGVGGGLVVGGKLIEGHQGIAGEWGHNQLDPNGAECYCGRIGCVETVISGPALEMFYERVSGLPTGLSQIVEQARRGTDPHASLLMEHLVQNFGKAIAAVVNILDPDAIVLGGGVGQIGELRTLGSEAALRHIFNPQAKINLVAPELGDSAGVFGAALL